MKKIALLFLIVFVVFACNRKKTVIVSGKIANPYGETVSLQINYLDQIDTIALADDGSFTLKVIIEQEFLGILRNGNLAVPVYLAPGATINIELDIEDIKNGDATKTIISGKGSEATALLYKLRNEGRKESTMQLVKMPLNNFKKVMDEAIKASDDAIANFIAIENTSSDKFFKTVKLIQKINFAQKYKYFINLHARVVPKDTLPIPASFQEYIDEVPVDNFEMCKEFSEYKFWVISHYSKGISETLQTDVSIKKGTVAYAEKNIDAITALGIPEDLKSEIAYQLLSSYSYSPDSIQKVYKTRYKEIIKKPEYLIKFEESISTVDKTKEGAIAPSWNYADINGKMVSSESLRGKVIYIDVWATWCGPCEVEIPHLKKMENELHTEDIAFVSISVDTNKKAWEAMVREKKLGGYQLFAKEAWESDIVKDYAISGIPRFIIIDKEGKIVEANASRPSNAETKDKLLKLAKS